MLFLFWHHGCVDPDGGWNWTAAGVGFAAGAGIGYAITGDWEGALLGGLAGGAIGGASFRTDTKSVSAGSQTGGHKIFQETVVPTKFGYASGNLLASAGRGYLNFELAQQEEEYPLKLKTASLDEIMKAFRHAYDLSRRDENHVMSDVFDTDGVPIQTGQFTNRFVRTYTNGVKFELYLNVHQNGTAQGYDGRVIDVVQPYYQYAAPLKKGRGWHIDPSTVPTSISVGFSKQSGYAYSISIYGTHNNNNRLATLFFNKKSAFTTFMNFVR